MQLTAPPKGNVMSVTHPTKKRNTRHGVDSERGHRQRARWNRTRTSPHTASADRRHTYVTHLVEFGYPERFVTEQVGHSYASTTAIYTSVSNDFKTKALQAALRRVYGNDEDNREEA